MYIFIRLCKWSKQQTSSQILYCKRFAHAGFSSTCAGLAVSSTPRLRSICELSKITYYTSGIS